MADQRPISHLDVWVPNGLRVRGMPAPSVAAPKVTAPATPAAKPLVAPGPANDGCATPNVAPSVRPVQSLPDAKPDLTLSAPALAIHQASTQASAHAPLWDSAQFQAQKPSATPKSFPNDGRPGFRPAPILTLIVLCCLGVLWSLGNWQYSKYLVKEAPAPIEAPIEPAPVSAALEAADPEYRPVVAEGIVDDSITKVYAVNGGVRGARLFSHIVLEAGVVFVDRGFVTEADMSKIKLTNGTVRLSGVLRRGAPSNNFTPDNDPASDTWYWPDLAAMASARGLDATSVSYYIAQDPVDPLSTGKPVENIWARPTGVSTVTAGQHLGYAWQWWGFGIGLLGVYIGWHMHNGRLSFRRR